MRTIEKRIEELKEKIFYLNMADKLEESDYILLNIYNEKLKKLKGEKIWNI